MGDEFENFREFLTGTAAKDVGIVILKTTYITGHWIILSFYTPTGRISHSNFSSEKFTLLYFSGNIPGSVKVSAILMCRNLNDFWYSEKAVEEVNIFVNENGDWAVLFWFERCTVTDKSLIVLGVTDNENSFTSEKIDAGKTSHHFT